ncbi:zinc finger odd-paired-like (opl) [Fusarium sp. NRRL 25303]|nr:zinc finger odd-paired-like (opl) [Fusarium sp. NRRL 25303]
MRIQYDPILVVGHAAQGLDQASVPRFYELNFGNEKDVDDWYMVPEDPNLSLDQGYPHVPSFTDDMAGAPYFILESPKQLGVDSGFAPVENGEFFLVDHPVSDFDCPSDAGMSLNNGYMLHGSYQSIDAPLVSPSSVDSTPESSPWDLARPFPSASGRDLSALNPGLCSISGRRQSETSIWSGASTPVTTSNDDSTSSSSLLALSLMETFRYPCTYKSCNKSFKRKEHAKRHFLTKHRPRQRRLQCEFCGKDTFTRTDNLNAHRRLHARRPAKHNSGVHFVPEALQVFEGVTKPNHNGKLMSFFL